MVVNVFDDLNDIITYQLCLFKGALDKFNIIPNFFQNEVGIFIPLEVLAWVMTAC